MNDGSQKKIGAARAAIEERRAADCIARGGSLICGA